MRDFKFLTFLIIGTMLLGTVAVARINQTNIESANKSFDDFYFVHLTDTHVRHKIVDLFEATSNRLKTVLEKITSFEKKPAFIAITGDLCEWAGSDPIGALNCKAFVSCFYEKEDQLYADSEFTIPVYTTPGNHDYVISRNLKNYHKYIDKNHIEDNDRYIVKNGNVSLFFMDSGPNHYAHPRYWTDIVGDGLYDCDIEWLESELINCNSEKKIILMHHPAINDRRDNGDMGGVIFRNREEFIDLCENYNVTLVLAGHTHTSRVYDSDEKLYDEDEYEYPLNSSLYSTLYVQSDDCKQGIHYRNISIISNDIWIENNQELKITFVDIQDRNVFINSPLEIFLSRIQFEKP